MGVANLHSPGVLAAFFIKRQVPEWLPSDIRQQLPASHRHIWVRPQQTFTHLCSTDKRVVWSATCRECLCQLNATIEAEGAGAENACIDSIGHHFHSTLNTVPETSNDQNTGPEAHCQGRVRCCKCTLAIGLSLLPPIIEPTMVNALSTARMRLHSHHPTQGIRELLNTVSTLFKLVKNACTGDTRPVKVSSEVPRRRLKFDPPCNHILEILGFELVNESEFCPPDIVRVAGEALNESHPDRNTRMAQTSTSLMFRRLERARQELCIWTGQIQRQLPKDERQAAYVSNFVNEQLETKLGVAKYESQSGPGLLLSSGKDEHSALEDAYNVLGVFPDMGDSVVAWAYRRLTEEDQSEDPVFGSQARKRFDSLVTISAARTSKELDALVANERERGLVATGAIKAASTALFGEPQTNADFIESDAMRDVFLARLEEIAAPKAKLELAEHLAVLAEAKQDQALMKYAANVLSSLQASAELEMDETKGVAAWKGKVDTWDQLPIGLKNIGNTCYLNSILQCLFSILPIRKAVMCYGDGKMWNEGARLGRRDGGRLLTKDEIASALRFVELLKKLFESLITQRVEGWATKNVRKSSGGHPLATSTAAAPLAVAPDKELADMLLLRIGAQGNSGSSTTGGSTSAQQQDVDECIAQCVSLLVHALPPISLMDSADQGADLSGPSDTWIYKMLAGKLEITTERTGDSQSSEKPSDETFVNLNLNIPNETTDINDCIDSFFAPSIVSGDMNNSADKNSDDMDTDTPQSQQLVRRSRIKSAPPVLCIQVQRVQFDMSTLRAFKINSHLRLREQVSLTPYVHFDGAAAAHSQKHALQQRLATINQHLGLLQVPVQTAANTDNAEVSVVSALERVQSFMSGISRWADIDGAKTLLSDLPQSASAITQNAQQVGKQLAEMAATLKEARLKWEKELQEVKEQLEDIYSNVPQDDMAYTLHAAFIHSGQTPEFGHYWVYIRDYDREKNLVRWLKFNDSHVSVVDASEIFRDAPKPGEESANPYYLVFVRTSDLDTTADLGV
ncbi:ubiquitin-specific protease ubp2 [Coemansia sp. RSA 1086]|nr:ubiquitin-specific protease ubp2 [Coemansia sp. RSA 1086]